MVSAQRKKVSRVKVKKPVLGRNFRKNVTNFAVISALFLLAGAFLSSFAFYKYLTQNFAAAMSPTSFSIQEDSSPTFAYIVLDNMSSTTKVIQKAQYIIIDKPTSKVLIYDIPLSLEVDVPGKFGVEKFDKIFALSSLENPNDFSAQLEIVNQTLFKIFGYKIDNYLIADSVSAPLLNNLWENGKLFSFANLKKSSTLKNHMVASFGLKDFYYLSNYINSLPDDRRLETTLPQTSLTDTDELDETIRDLTIDSAIAQEKKNIAVLNGTGVAGVASFSARVISNFGGRVSSIGNTLQDYAESYLIVDDPNSTTVVTLARVFHIKNIIQKAEAEHFNESVIPRSDVILILGFDTTTYL